MEGWATGLPTRPLRGAPGLRSVCLTPKLSKSSVVGKAQGYQSAGTTEGHRSDAIRAWFPHEEPNDKEGSNYYVFFNANSKKDANI